VRKGSSDHLCPMKGHNRWPGLSMRLSNIHLWSFIYTRTLPCAFLQGTRPNVPDHTSQIRHWSKNYWTKSGDLGIRFLLKDSPSIGSFKVVEVRFFLGITPYSAYGNIPSAIQKIPHPLVQCEGGGSTILFGNHPV
jgi:hypothetical protein